MSRKSFEKTYCNEIWVFLSKCSILKIFYLHLEKNKNINLWRKKIRNIIKKNLILDNFIIDNNLYKLMSIFDFLTESCSAEGYADDCAREILILIIVFIVFIYSLYCTIKLFMNWDKVQYEFYTLVAVSISAAI